MFDEVGVFLDNGRDAPLLKILFFIRLEVERDRGSLRFPVGGSERELLLSAGLPADRFLLAGLERVDHHLVRDHERRVKSYAELTDQLRIRLRFPFFFTLRQILQKCLGSGMGDGAEIFDHLFPAHADSVVGDAECSRLGIRSDPDLPVLGNLGIGEREKTRLVNRVSRVGNQLPQKDFLVGINRMNHHVQKFSDFCLKTQIFHTPGLLVCRSGLMSFRLRLRGVVRGGVIVVAVESGAFEDHRGSAPDLAFQRILPAFRTVFQMLLRHLLKFLELISAACADIIIRWHFG